MALLSDRTFFSAHDVFGPYDALTLTLTLCPNPPLGSAPSELHQTPATRAHQLFFPFHIMCKK